MEGSVSENRGEWSVRGEDQQDDDNQPQVPRLAFDPAIFTASSFEPVELVDRITTPIITAARPKAGAKVKKPVRVARDLVEKLKAATRDAENAVTEHSASLAALEAEARAVEAKEKVRLGRVSAGLDQTGNRLTDIEEVLRGALALTVGVDQKLNHATARVSRGKVAMELLHHLQMFTQFNPSSLTDVLGELSSARKLQREAVTAEWDRGTVAISFGTPASTYVEDPEDIPEGDSSAIDAAHKRCAERGLGRLFSRRSSLVDAVTWVQKLHQLVRDMPHNAVNIAPVEIYVNWIQKELVAEYFHLLDAFTVLYDHLPAQALAHPRGKLILRAAEFISRLHSSLVQSSDALVEATQSFLQEAMKEVITNELMLTPMPPPPPMPEPMVTPAVEFFAEYTQGEIESVFEFILERLRRDVVIMDAAFPNAPHAKNQLARGAFDGVVRDFVGVALRASNDHSQQTLMAEARLSPRSKRKSQARVIDALSYHMSTMRQLYVSCATLVEKASEAFGKQLFDTASITIASPSSANPAMSPTTAATTASFLEVAFPMRAAYVEGGSEHELLRRALDHAEDSYLRELAPLPDQPYDVRAAHTLKAKQYLDAISTSASRLASLATPMEVGPLVVQLFGTGIAYISKYIVTELTKVQKGLKNEVSSWNKLKPGKTPLKHYGVRQPGESHLCAIRVVVWAELTITEFLAMKHRMFSKLGTGQSSSLIEASEKVSEAVEAADELAEAVVQLAIQAFVIRSLTILLHVQQKTDYKVGEKKKKKKGDDDDEAGLAGEASQACDLFCTYVGFQLEEMKTFLEGSNRRNSALHLRMGGSTMSSSGFHARTPSFDIQHVRHHSRTMSNSVQDVSDESLASILTSGDSHGRNVSLCRLIGVAFYRGLIAHLTAFQVNDAGAVVYKRDVAYYRDIGRRLSEMCDSAKDASALNILFDLLSDTANVLMVPLDNIMTVINSGNLRLLSKPERHNILKMRTDVRKAFRIIEE